MNKFLTIFLCFVFLPGVAIASDDRTMVTDVADTQFSIVWAAQEPASCSLKVFSDSGATQEITDQLLVLSESELQTLAEDNGVMKVTVKQLSPNTTYFVKTVTIPKSSGLNEVASNILEVTTEIEPKIVSNNILVQEVKQSNGTDAAIGTLLIVDVEEASTPLSAWVGDGYPGAYAGIDLTNLYHESSHKSYDVETGKSATLFAFGGRLGYYTTENVLIDENNTNQLVQPAAILEIEDVNTIVLVHPVMDKTVNEDSENLIIDLSDVFVADPENSSINKAIVSNSNDILLDASIAGDLLTISYNEEESGTATIKIEATATDYISASDEFVVTVSPVDDPPVVDNPISDKNVKTNSENQVIPLNSVFTDIDNDDSLITKTASSADNSLVVVSVDGNSLNLDFQENQTGSTTIEVVGTSNGKTATDSFDVFISSYTPAVVSFIDSYRAVANSSIAIPIFLTNSMNDEIEGLNAKVTYNSDVLEPQEPAVILNGIISSENYNINSDYSVPGQISLSLFGKSVLSNESGIIAELNFLVIGSPGETSELAFEESILNNSHTIKQSGLFTVKSPPKTFDSSITVNEDSSVTFNLDASDADDDSLIFLIIPGNSNGNAVMIDNTLGTCKYTPKANENGTDAFVFMVNDGNANSNTSTVTVTINPVNDPPTVSSISNINGCKNISASINFTIDDIDSNLDVLSFDYETSITAQVSFSGEGNNRTLSVNPLTEYAGTTSITVIVSDGIDSTQTSFDFITNDIGLQIGSTNESKLYPGQEFSVPLVLTSEVAVQSISMTVIFDSNILTTNDSVATLAGGILENQGYNLSVLNKTTNSASIFFESTDSAIVANGTIAYLKFMVDENAVVGSETSISCHNNQALFNDWTMTARKADYIVDGYLISGNIGFYPDQSDLSSALTPVNNVNIALVGSKVYSTTSDDSGNYSFINIPPGTYVLELTKTDDLNGMNLLDAYWISRHYNQPQHLSCYQQIAANADNDSEATVRGIDASRVARYKMFFIDKLNEDNIHWVFLDEEINDCSEGLPRLSDLSSKVLTVDSNKLNQDFIAIKVGDVTRNWKKTEPDLKRSRRAIKTNRMSYPVEDSMLSLPIYFNQDDQIKGMQIRITYDKNNLEFINADFNQSQLEYSNYILMVNNNVEGELYLGILAQKEVLSVLKEEILSINFERLSNDAADISITDFECNESPVSDSGFQIDDQITQHIFITDSPSH